MFVCCSFGALLVRSCASCIVATIASIRLGWHPQNLLSLVVAMVTRKLHVKFLVFCMYGE
jgi:hypothetical protein